jgi:PmbA protein
VRRLEPQRISTRTATVVFEPRAAAGLLGHFLGAINGASIARGTSFLKNRMGDKVFAGGVRITDDPVKPRGLASRPFDGEGVPGAAIDLVADGVLSSWLLDAASARELGLSPNGRAARGLDAPRPGATNVTLHPGTTPPDRLLQEIGNGLYVTDLIGQGVNLVTGDYSRGAFGYWIENGAIAYPVSEITVAGNLADMFARMVLADDGVEFATMTAPTVAIEGMTIGGL